MSEQKKNFGQSLSVRGAIFLPLDEKEEKVAVDDAQITSKNAAKTERVPPGHKYCRARAGIIVHHGDEKKNEEVWGEGGGRRITMDIPLGLIQRGVAREKKGPNEANESNAVQKKGG